VHEYFGVDYQILWEIIENELPILIELLKSIKKIINSPQQLSPNDAE
jgi:uncharacterized protein with HEPN domain